MTATLSVDQLLNLARVYSAATGRTLGGVGKRAINNHHFFIRLARGHGGNTESVARVTKWFAENWPDNARWPKGVPGKARQGGRMGRMPNLLPIEESNILELSLADDQLGKLRVRLRIDRVIDWRLAAQIIRMIGDAESGAEP